MVLLYLDKVLGQLCKPIDCYDVKCYRLSTAKRGVYIYPNSTALPKLLVTCDQIAGGGGWIFYLRRFDGSVLFNRTFAEYKNGFGQQGRNKESWLGNEKVQQLDKTFKGGTRLRIQGFLLNGTSCVIDTDNFKLEGKSYILKLGKIVSNVNPAIADWRYQNNRIFTAMDSDIGRCHIYKGGWWYDDCHTVYLTGYYPPSYEHKYTYYSMYIQNFATVPLTAANMLIRPMVTTRPDCNNPCKNNAGCEYVESTNNYHCACPKTLCGLHCEKDNPCKNNGTCVYSPKTKDTSCVCVANYTGNLCNIRITTTTPATTPAKASEDLKTSNVPFIMGVLVSLMLLFILLMIAVGMYLVINKKTRAREEEERRRQEEEEEREAEEDEETVNDTMFGFMSGMFY